MWATQAEFQRGTNLNSVTTMITTNAIPYPIARILPSSSCLYMLFTWMNLISDLCIFPLTLDNQNLNILGVSRFNHYWLSRIEIGPWIEIS